MSNFYEGQKVVCISEDFPVVYTINKGYESKDATHPVKGETLVIDEILGDYLRFDKYDCDDPNSERYGFNWWHNSRFRPLDEFEITSSALQISEKETVKITNP